jgi:hypothetical protein
LVSKDEAVSSDQYETDSEAFLDIDAREDVDVAVEDGSVDNDDADETKRDHKEESVIQWADQSHALVTQR